MTRADTLGTPNFQLSVTEDDPPTNVHNSHCQYGAVDETGIVDQGTQDSFQRYMMQQTASVHQPQVLSNIGHNEYQNQNPDYQKFIDELKYEQDKLKRELADI